MPEQLSLHIIDWLIIIGYLALALAVGILVRKKAETSKESYFLAGRSIPWWWAGLSIAATTFAADTPLAITGIVASKGISGNWIWLSWVGVHAAVVVLFAKNWNKSEVLTDAEIVSLRYSGRSAEWLRWFRAGLYGLVYNCIILGWVLKAMSKIASPFFRWDEWFPAFMHWCDSFWPQNTPLGTASEGLTVITLLAIVGIYSTLGGIRGVILTDVLQLAMALVGSVWFAWIAWDAVGGQSGLVSSIQNLYGNHNEYLNLFPSTETGWLSAVGVGAFMFGMYLIVQSYANVPSDGGGYLMQRLNTTPSQKDARKAAWLFLILQYVIRVWPWFLVATAAIVLIPIGQEQLALEGVAGAVGGDRELAYPVLMAYLLPTAVLGLLVASLLAAFMSTVDTHLNWGGSYIVNDIFLRIKPKASRKAQVLVARLAVSGFVILAVLVSFQIDTIEQAWKWVAALGASLGIPTALRWVWWRVSASSELGAMATGLTTAVILWFVSPWAYEINLVVISGASLVGFFLGMVIGPKTDQKTIDEFNEKVTPEGIWPVRQETKRKKALGMVALRWLSLVSGVVCTLYSGTQVFFKGDLLEGVVLFIIGSIGIWWSVEGK